MYRTILVPLDGSVFGERALPMARTLAQAMQAQVVLMSAASAAVFPGTDATEAQCQAVRETRAYLETLVPGLTEQGLQVEIAVPYGDAAEAILVEIGLHRADLVVMCTQGRSGLGRWIYGSVAEQVLARSPVPVLLVRASGETPWLGPGPEQSALLVPLDGSAFAEMALPHAAALARTFGGTILLVRAIAPPMALYSYPGVRLAQDSLNEESREAESYLEEVAERLRGDRLAVTTVVREGWPAEVITNPGVNPSPRLVVMATHGRTGVERLLLGSVALEVVRRGSLPVLLIRPSGHAAS